MGVRIDLTGNRFGKWTVIGLHSTGTRTFWNCICDCGTKSKVESYCLKTGHSISCGCSKKESTKNKLPIVIGEKRGKLTLISEDDRIYTPSGQPNRMVKVKCDCGNIKSIRLLHWVRNRILSCGCLNGEYHGMHNTKLYRVWNAMKQRCNADYTNECTRRNYKERGITVCNEWEHSFISFSSWAFDNGYSEGLEIDRIDVNGNYEPNNCRWVTRLINANNTRSNVFITAFGKRMTIAQWSRYSGISASTINNRLKRNKNRTMEEIVSIKNCFKEAREKGFKRSKFQTVK